MEFYEVVNRRRSIRQFEEREIPREVLERILDAGLKAPSSNHQRRWELVTLTDKAMIKELAKLIRPYPCRIQEPKTPQQEMFKIAYPRQSSMVEESACVILPYFKQKYPMTEDKNGYGLMDYGATWALVETYFSLQPLRNWDLLSIFRSRKSRRKSKSYCISRMAGIFPHW